MKEIERTGEVYEELRYKLNNLYPNNNKQRLMQIRNHLLNLMMTMDTRKLGIPPHLFRGVCGELMFEFIAIYYKKINPNLLVMKNLLIPKKDGGTTQIDYLLMTPQTILVVEVKTMFGNLEIDKGIITSVWRDDNGNTQSLELKPWGQNMSHIYHIRDYLDLQYLYMENAVFLFGVHDVQSCQLNDNQHLLTFTNSLSRIGKLLTMGQGITKEDASHIVRNLQKTIPTTKQEVKHVKDILQSKRR